MVNRSAAVALLLAVPLLVAAALSSAHGFVNDQAGLLDAAGRAELAERLRAVEQETTVEIAVATVTSLDGTTVEDYANRLFKAWGVGKKGRDNGVLLLVAPAERKVRIEVGYGLEPILPDGLAGEIIRQACLPRFKAGDYPGGIRDGVARIASVVRASHVLTVDERRALDARQRPPAWAMIPFFALFIAPGFFAIGLGCRIKTVNAVMFGVIFGGAAFVMAMIPFFNAVPLLQLGLAIAMSVWGYRKGASLDWIVRFRRPPADGGPLGGWVAGESPTYVTDWSGGSSGGSSSSASDGGFGGGSSGGGGASGSW